MANANPSTSAPTTQGEARRGDGLLVVLQNNEQKTLLIHRMNPVVEKLLGYEENQALGRRLEVILGPSTAELLDEAIEYADDAPDLGDVLAKYREIRLRHRLGQEINVTCTVSRLMSEGMNACFQLVIPDERELLANRKIRDFIALNLEGRKQLDAATGLPNRATALEFLPLLKNYLAEGSIEASFAVLRLDRHTKSLARYGEAGCIKLLQHAAQCCQASFRSEDIVFALSDHTLGIVLFDISRESARVVLNRLRWNIGTHRIEFGGKSDFTVTTSICFDMIDPETGADALDRCETAIKKIDMEERNGLVELGN